MNEYEVPAYLEEKLPGIKTDLDKLGNDISVYKAMQTLVQYINNMTLQHDIRTVKRSFQVAEQIYEKGNTIVKNAVENVIVYSISSMRPLCNEVEWRLLQAYMPIHIYSLYVQQVLKSNV